jgi:hypothetical protein
MLHAGTAASTSKWIASPPSSALNARINRGEAKSVERLRSLGMHRAVVEYTYRYHRPAPADALSFCDLFCVRLPALVTVLGAEGSVEKSHAKRKSMIMQVCAACRLAACVMTALAAVACAPTSPPASPALMVRCSHLYELWWRYDEDPVFFGLAEKPTAELGFVQLPTASVRRGYPGAGATVATRPFPLSRR